MGAPRVAFERREPSNSRMEHVEVLRYRQIINIVESLHPFNFDLAQAPVHRIHARVVGGCAAVSGASGGIDRHRGQAVAKRVHSRTRLAFLTAWTAAFCSIVLVRRDLPLRCHQLAFLTIAAALASIALTVAKRSASARRLEDFSSSFRYWLRRFCADTIRRSMGAKIGNASWNASTSTALDG